MNDKEKNQIKNGEYIRRKDALDIFSKYMFAGYRGNGKSFFNEIVMPTFYNAIAELPSADVVEVKHGSWFDKGSLSCRCSNCGCKSLKESKFCPECGADMREMKGEQNEYM